jgi:hypothetical protein
LEITDLSIKPERPINSYKSWVEEENEYVFLLFDSIACSNLNRAAVVVADFEEEVEAEEVGAIEAGKTIE